MTERIPTPGGDTGNWADILDAWLLVARNPDGTLKQSAVQAALGGSLPAVPATGLLARAFPPTSLNRQTDGIITSGNYLISHNVRESCHSIQLAYGNWYNLAGQEAAGLNDITVRAGFTTPAGVIIPVFFNGQRDIVIKPGATVWSDVIDVELKVGDLPYSRTYVTVGAGNKWPISLITVGGVEGADTASNTDKTTSGTISPSTSFSYGPYAILATPKKRGIPVIVLQGDSVAMGFGDVSPSDTGWFHKGINEQLAWQQLSFPSDNVNDWARRKDLGATYDATLRRALIRGMTHAVCAQGRNSLTLTLNQLQLGQIDIWRWMQARGYAWSTLGTSVYQTTITPQTTSTDAWATTVNQTVADVTKEGKRVQFNDWLRDGAPIDSSFAPQATGASGGSVIRAGSAGHPLSGYLEVADHVESARNSGIWKAPSYTTDGTHPTATGDADIKTVVVIANFGSVAAD